MCRLSTHSLRTDPLVKSFTLVSHLCLQAFWSHRPEMAEGEGERPREPQPERSLPAATRLQQDANPYRDLWQG